MKVSGFSMIKNAVIMGYPLVESITSALPLVDEFVIGLGQSDDKTEELINSIGSPKIKIFPSHWDLQNTSGGTILSDKTNEALKKCENDWCLYLQADEVLHEKDYPEILNKLKMYENDTTIDGLLFNYRHLYGSFSIEAKNHSWYRKEIRAVRKSSGAYSFRDAQGFRKNNDKKLCVAQVAAEVYHYGWVKPPQKMGEKTRLFSRLWHGNKLDSQFDNFQFEQQYGMQPFNGAHPQIMKKRVGKQNWNFNPKMGLSDWNLKNIRLLLSALLESTTGLRLGEYKPYKLVK